MSRLRAFSSPDLVPSSTSTQYERADDHGLEGIAANVKLLLKLIQDHNEVNTRENEERKVVRVAGMMSIIDDVKSRIQKSQSPTAQQKEFRRCNTELRPNNIPRDSKKSTHQQDPLTMDEKQKLRKELSASLAARKSLEIMCSSLGKEKEIMASELARKVQELNGMEELTNDLKEQNEMLLEKLQTLKKKAAEAEAARKEKKKGAAESFTNTASPLQGNAALQDRNKALSEQLLKSLDGYRSLKRKFKEAKEENSGIRAAMEEMEMEVHGGLESLCSFRQRIASTNEDVNIQEEVSALQHMFECFSMKISKHQPKKSEIVKPKRDINSSKTSVLQERKG